MEIFAQDLLQNSPEETTQNQNQTINFGVSESQLLYTTEFVANGLNFFSLAFSIFYGIILMITFFEYRMFNSRRKYLNEKIGSNAALLLLHVWQRYFLLLAVFTMYDLTRNSLTGVLLTVVLILVFLYKLLKDTKDIASCFVYFKWSKKIADNIKNYLTW